MSELSPLDILGKKFAVKFRGYPANEVHEYLTEIAGGMESLMRERGELRQQVHRWRPNSRFSENVKPRCTKPWLPPSGWPSRPWKRPAMRDSGSSKTVTGSPIDWFRKPTNDRA